MHIFSELIDRCTATNLHNLNEIHEQTIDALQTSGATSLVKTLQMLQLQKVILAVGMFSIFEAHLQDSLNCKNGFRKAKQILDNEAEYELKELFENYYSAINVLKHGKGSSYEFLVAKAETLPFQIKLPEQAFFSEGDVSEISTLIQVDEYFIQDCANLIRDVSQVINRNHIGFL